MLVTIIKRSIYYGLLEPNAVNRHAGESLAFKKLMLHVEKGHAETRSCLPNAK